MNAFHERHAFWQAKEQEPWSKGKNERRQILSALKEIPRMSLDQAVNLMAFGTLEVPSDLEVVGAPLEEIARRRQAAAALFEAARSARVQLVGDPQKGGDKSEPISPMYFDMRRSLGHVSNSIDTEPDQDSMEVYVAWRQGAHQAWFNVRVICESFASWISPPALSVNAQKRFATTTAIKALGPEVLQGPCTKTIEDQIVERVRADINQQISTRYVRKIYGDVKRGTQRCS